MHTRCWKYHQILTIAEAQQKMNLKLFQNVKWHKENVAIIVSFKSEGIYCGAKERLLPGPLTGPWEGL